MTKDACGLDSKMIYLISDLIDNSQHLITGFFGILVVNQNVIIDNQINKLTGLRKNRISKELLQCYKVKD